MGTYTVLILFLQLAANSGAVKRLLMNFFFTLLANINGGIAYTHEHSMASFIFGR